jgi:hypothetical protein
MTDTTDVVAEASAAVARAKELASALQDGRKRLGGLLAELHRQQQELRSLAASAKAQLSNMRALSDQLCAALDQQPSGALAAAQKRSAPLGGGTPGGITVPQPCQTRTNGGSSHPAQVASTLDLQVLMRALDLLGIYSGVHTCADGLQAWVSDRSYLHREDRLFRRTNGGAISNESVATLWLHDRALRLLNSEVLASHHQRQGRLPAAVEPTPQAGPSSVRNGDPVEAHDIQA